jgi:hypothetical protein
MRCFAKISLSCSVFVGAILLPVSGWAANRKVDCGGGTAGAFSSLQAAIDSLDQVGPHQIAVVTTTPCSENVQIMDRQRLTIIATSLGGGTFLTSKAGASGDVMTISGSTGITLTLLGFTGGSRGIVIDRASEVSIHGTTIQGNVNAGIRIDGNSTVEIDGLIQKNGGAGINANDSSLILGGGTQILNNGGAGVALTGSRGQFYGNSIQGNATGVVVRNASSADFFPTTLVENNQSIGVNVINGSSAQVFAPNLIQNNGSIGVNVSDGGSVRFFGDVAADGSPLANVIDGNPFIGLNIDGGQVVLFDANQILNNGSGGQSFHAGVRVDDNGSLITNGSGDIQISKNNGPGIDATTGGNVDLAGTIVASNNGDGIRLQGNAQLSFFPPNTNVVSGNVGKPVKCDTTSVFFGDITGVGQIACRLSQNEDNPSHSQRRSLILEERWEK